MGQAHTYHANSPQYHDDGYKDAGSQAFEEDVGDGLEEGVGDEEDGETGIVLAASDMKTCSEAVKFGVADICTVKEGDEVEETEPGDETEIELP